MAGMIIATALAQGQGIDKKKLTTGNKKSPEAETSATIGGKQVWIFYHAPSVRGRKIFNGAGALEPDDSVWRLGADYATVLHTSGALQFRGLEVPPGEYSLYVFLDKGRWQLIVNKKTGQWGVNNDDSTTDVPGDELGRVPMTMAKNAGAVETLKIDLEQQQGNRGAINVKWENVSATAPFTVK